MTLASWITLSRIILVIPTVWLLSTGHYGWALCLILISALTDYLDGLAARKLNQISDVGKVLDQVADKIFVNSVFIVMAIIGLIPSWFVVVTVGRDFLVNGFRTLCASKGVVVPADIWGKLKTVFQFVLMISVLLMPAHSWFVRTVLWFALVLILFSGVSYIRKMVRIMEGIR